MTKAATCRLPVFTILASLAAAALHAATPTAVKPAAHAKPELAAAAQAAVQRGFHAELPPHVSTLLGLTREEKCGVLQGVLRSSEKIQGFEVTEKNHNDIILFTVDQATQDQTFYLTSPSGELRRELSVKQGIGYVVKPTKTDADAFEREKQIWEQRMAAQTPAK